MVDVDESAQITQHLLNPEVTVHIHHYIGRSTETIRNICLIILCCPEQELIGNQILITIQNRLLAQKNILH
ncbi:MAG: hypothetical protein JNIBNLAF_02471 [Nitrosomonas europaea]|nr:hypothetical protein [Nitrosomonas europaea]